MIRQLDENIFNIIPEMSMKINVYLLSPNRRIKEVFYDTNIEYLENLNLLEYKENYNFPFIRIENALNKELLDEVYKIL